MSQKKSITCNRHLKKNGLRIKVVCTEQSSDICEPTTTPKINDAIKLVQHCTASVISDEFLASQILLPATMHINGTKIGKLGFRLAAMNPSVQVMVFMF